MVRTNQPSTTHADDFPSSYHYGHRWADLVWAECQLDSEQIFVVKPAAPFNNKHFPLNNYILNHFAAVDSEPVRVQTVSDSELAD